MIERYDQFRVSIVSVQEIRSKEKPSSTITLTIDDGCTPYTCDLTPALARSIAAELVQAADVVAPPKHPAA